MNERYPVIESFGYLISIVSVTLLALATWLTAQGRPILRITVVTGATLSVLGMILRWYVWWRRHGRRRPRK
ncbi:MAG: hypothetical protein WDM96_13680 [Lacunisphaera sp.]